MINTCGQQADFFVICPKGAWILSTLSFKGHSKVHVIEEGPKIWKKSLNILLTY